MHTINIDKTKYKIFGSQQNSKGIQEMYIMISKQIIKQKFRYLRVWFDQHPNWNEQPQILADNGQDEIRIDRKAIQFLRKTNGKLLASTLARAAHI